MSEDRFTRRARPAFLYVMYALLLGAGPVALVAALSPATAAAMTRAMAAYLAALPEPLYALFGTGYIGYTAAREWGKARPAARVAPAAAETVRAGFPSPPAID
ncbi:3TM-type holin [Sphingomonas morindae]|uniref:Holin family protein n=1 Tax=Sphingomonas morindae TaxID=1541170 RepID=A0ABY4XA38_9SPHN|nr:3TM-type holin [Sphingomonas morindae]USI73794.1 holin family protein [Sphingomonas morindae]